ncbi:MULTISPECIES: YqaA family protein [Gulbenkiania]|uniref:YqaA family protein n=1 Tax=Gulbenkiania TaxID=397456 RepID=UPI0013BEA940|nr:MULTISPECIES: DedA family protein [Gulbenkiania]
MPAALAGVALSAFVSATLLPGNSEIALGAFVHAWPAWMWSAWLVATLANGAGSLVSYGMGRMVPPRPLPARTAQAFRRFGPSVLFLAWVPFIGDALPLAAGWLRLPWLSSAVWILLGKGVRYFVLIRLVEAWQ